LLSFLQPPRTSHSFLSFQWEFFLPPINVDSNSAHHDRVVHHLKDKRSNQIEIHTIYFWDPIVDRRYAWPSHIQFCEKTVMSPQMMMSSFLE
jgi:hypothetical protein